MTTKDCVQTTCSNNAQCEEQDACEQAIREQAYLLWEAAGQPEGDGQDFWFEAETKLSEEYSTTTQSCGSKV